VSSDTSTVPRTLEMSTRGPARVALISKRSTPYRTSSNTSPRSPRINTKRYAAPFLLSPANRGGFPHGTHDDDQDVVAGRSSTGAQGPYLPRSRGTRLLVRD
jgi:hypothetical protein